MNIYSGIYKWKNIGNGKIYIGSAINLYNRKQVHLHLLKTQKHQLKFQNAWNKYGKNNFVFKIIELVANKSKLIEREQYYLDILLFAKENNNKFDKLGYNLCRKADSSLGVKKTEQQKKIIGKKLKGAIPWNKGKKTCYTKQTLSRMSKSQRNRKKVICRFCNKKFDIANYKRYHGDKCILNPKINIHTVLKSRKFKRKPCVHCKGIFALNKLNQYHNEHCFKNPDIDIKKEKQNRKQSKKSRRKAKQTMKHLFRIGKLSHHGRNNPFFNRHHTKETKLIIGRKNTKLKR